ncbi:MAG TPA: FG-GAP-like repeat-containing protein [Gemmataceae bacterium]|nr:FG-GAP-like repeat-containing protein [Gemmataceae bacterium]
MAQQSRPRSLSLRAARHRRTAKTVNLRCEQFEDKIVPALFNVVPQSSIAGLNNNGCVVTADLNGDGFMDAVLTNEGTDLNTGGDRNIIVLYGRSGGGFTRSSYDTGGTNVAFAAIGDINGDGLPDVVAVDENGQNVGSVAVFRNNGAAGLSMVGSPFQPGGNNSAWVGLADVTGDHVLDVVVASFGASNAAGDNVSGNKVTIFQGNADGQGKGNFSFSNGPITTLAPEIQFVPTSLAVADFDGDGITDIAAAVPGVPPDSTQPQPNGNVYLFKGTGAGGFAAPNQFDTGGPLPVNIQAADVNGDGKKDLIVANAGNPQGSTEFTGNSVGVILNVSTSGNLAFGITNTLNANCYGTFAVAVADFNMDGKQDIAAVNYGSANNLTPNAFVSIYTGNGTGIFQNASPGTYDLGWNLPGGQYLAAADFNNNGSQDLIVVGAVNRVTVLDNTSTTSALPSVSGVAINNGAAQRSMVQSVTVNFSGLVNFVGGQAAAANAFQLRQAGSSTNVTVNVDLSGSTATQTIAKLTFSGAFTEGPAANPSLKDGNYTLTVLSSQITGGLAGGDNVSSLFRLYGDIDGNKTVNGSDLTAFRTAFGSGQTDPTYVATLDFNGDGAINGSDLTEFRSRFGVVLP